MGKRVTKTEVTQARRMRDDGCTYKAIAEALGRSKAVWQYHLKGEDYRDGIRRKAATYAKRPENKERRRENHKKWEATQSSEQMAEHRRKAREKRAGRLDVKAKQALGTAFWRSQNEGVAAINATWEELVAAWDGHCYLCGVPEIECKKRFHADHNHTTGEFRGWACQRCNTYVIPVIENNSDLIDKFRAMFPTEQASFVS